jgi:sugar phosphate isomerase/epimerase
MKFGVSISIFRNELFNYFSKGCKGYKDMLKKLIMIKNKYDLESIEIWSEPPISAKLLLEHKDQIKSILLDTHSSFHLPFIEINLATFNEIIRKESINEIKSCIDFCHFSDIQSTVLHPGRFNFFNIGLKNLLMNNINNAILDLVNYAKNKNVNICLENLTSDQKLFTQPKDFDFLIENGAFLCLDTGHALTNNIDPLDFVNKFKQKVIHIHLHSNFGKEDLHLPLGEGKLNYLLFLKKINENGYNPNIIFELSSEKDLENSIDLIENIK